MTPKQLESTFKQRIGRRRFIKGWSYCYGMTDSENLKKSASDNKLTEWNRKIIKIQQRFWLLWTWRITCFNAFGYLDLKNCFHKTIQLQEMVWKNFRYWPKGNWIQFIMSVTNHLSLNTLNLTEFIRHRWWVRQKEINLIIGSRKRR
jgi:hypothetical protein